MKNVFKVSIIGTMLILSGLVSAKEDGEKSSNQYIQNPNAVKPSKQAIDLVKKEQENLMAGKVETFDNSKPGKWKFTITTQVGDKKEKMENEECITKEILEANKFKDLSKIALGDSGAFDCLSSFNKVSQNVGTFKGSCTPKKEVAENKKINKDAYAHFSGKIESKEESNNLTMKIIMSNGTKNDRGNEILEIYVTNKGKRIGNCTSFNEK